MAGKEIKGDEATAREVAENLAAWAKDNNLFSAVGIEDVVEDEDDAFIGENTPSFTAHAVVEVLRKRAINLIGFSESEKKVVIFTSGKLNKTDRRLLPFHANGYTFEYLHGGVAQVKGNPPPGYSKPFTLHNDAYTCGSSIFPAHFMGAGTLGFLARDAAGDLVGVSNNHVTGACNSAMPGLPILAPGPLDAIETACDPFTIGRHHRLLPINDGIPENVSIADNLDVAVFKISDSSKVSSMQGHIADTPALIADPEPPMKVEKMGRTTGHTIGRIVAQAATPMPVSYTVNEYGIRKNVYFNNAFIVQGENGLPFSKPGDSGSLVFGTNADGDRCSVGIVFAGNEQRGQSFILPLRPILDRLDLTIVTGHNA